MTSQSPSTRKQCDFSRLMMAGYNLELPSGNTQEFFVTFHGPKDSAYEEGVWRVHVVLPDNYPFASPSIGFVEPIYHPNIDFKSGTVCLDVINQTWTPLYSLVNIFEIFLPQLLVYPNPEDPLNIEAAQLYLSDEDDYIKTIKKTVEKHAHRRVWESHMRKKKEQEISSGDLSSLRPYSREFEDDLETLDIDDI